MLSVLWTVARPASKPDQPQTVLPSACGLGRIAAGLAYTSTSQSQQKEELMFGRVIRTRLDLLHPDVRKGVIQQQVTQKHHHDVKVRGERQFEVGDDVFARNYGVGMMWLSGTIVGIDGPVSYVVKLEDGRTWRRHTDQLRKRESALSGNLPTGPDMTAADGVGGCRVPPVATSPAEASQEMALLAAREEASRRIASSSAAPGSPSAGAGSSSAGPSSTGALGAVPRVAAGSDAVPVIETLSPLGAAERHVLPPAGTSSPVRSDVVATRRSARVRRQTEFYRP